MTERTAKREARERLRAMLSGVNAGEPRASDSNPHPERLAENGSCGFNNIPSAVMPGLVPGIHVLLAETKKDVDGRDKPGHDEGLYLLRSFPARL